eukprot:g23018.t1
MPTNFRSNGRVYLLDNFASFHARDLNQKALSLADDACAAALEVQQLYESMRTSIFLEATDALGEAGLSGDLLSFSAEGGDEPPVYELRTYQLKLGYTTVPTFVEKYTNGLKEKLAADQTGQSHLVSLMYSEAVAGSRPLLRLLSWPSLFTPNICDQFLELASCNNLSIVASCQPFVATAPDIDTAGQESAHMHNAATAVTTESMVIDIGPALLKAKETVNEGNEVSSAQKKVEQRGPLTTSHLSVRHLDVCEHKHECRASEKAKRSLGAVFMLDQHSLSIYKEMFVVAVEQNVPLAINMQVIEAVDGVVQENFQHEGRQSGYLDPRQFPEGSDLWVQYREREHVRLMWMSTMAKVFEIRLLQLWECRHGAEEREAARQASLRAAMAGKLSRDMLRAMIPRRNLCDSTASSFGLA